MRLVFVHGMHQEGRSVEALSRAWRDSLFAAWAAAGLPRLEVEPEIPFYGDKLDQLTRELAAGRAGLLPRGEMPEPSPTEQALLTEFARANGVDAADIRGQLSSEVVAKGPANWQWVQATARALEARVPAFRTFGIRLVQQVDAYLNRPHVTNAVDDIVGPALRGAPAVVVAHSLGTIVSYCLMRRSEPGFRPPLFVTLGSPLGIQAVRDRIRPPKLAVPDGVGRWVNGADQRDYVALYAALDAANFADGIENITDIHNRRADPHAFTDYLQDDQVARAIHRALSRESPIRA